jgi:ubiquinone/menaquinone biosynthesis C-methylase UbiE
MIEKDSNFIKRLMRAFMRIFYKLLYHRMAWTYDFVAATVSVGMWQEWVKSVIPYLKGPHILELGHGPGHLQKALLDDQPPGSFTAGLDFSPQMGRMAQRRLRRWGKEASLVNGDARKLPFDNESFNAIVATFPSEYMYNLKTLAEIHRVLKIDGELVVLPLAYITGKRPMDRAAAFLFKVTGQAPEIEQSDLKPAKKAGFDFETNWIELDKSKLLIIIARKSQPKSSLE